MVAIRTDSTLGTNFTQATLFAAIKAAMLNAGFSNPIDDYTSGTDRIAVYAFVTDATKTYGTTYYRVKVTSALGISSTLFATWNVTSHSGTQQGAEANYSAFSTSNTIQFTALNGGSEYKFVFLTQTTVIIPLGVIAPENKPNWWNLNNWNYAFYLAATSLTTLQGTTLSPYANSSYSLLINNSLMINANLQTGDTDVLTGLIVLSASGRGIAGKTSDDLGSACVNATTRYNTIATDNINQNFLIINPVSGGLVIKV
jgi:hypothetical protein